MLFINKNSANYLITTLTELQTLTGATYFLVNLNSQDSNIEYNVICSDVSSATTRYNKLVLIESTSENLTGSTITLPVGEYIYKVYEQISSTNLDPTISTSLLEQGLITVDDGTESINYIDDDQGITFKVIE
jgi:hypothetical protein